MSDFLIARIVEVFHGVARPPEITKSVARALDDDWKLSPSQAEERRASDGEAQWTDIPDEEIEAFDDIFPFLDSQGYLFYLPAFMSYSLRRYMDSDSCALDAPIHACANGCDRMKLFSPEQVALVIEFLEFCARHDGKFDAPWARYAIDHLRLSALKSETQTHPNHPSKPLVFNAPQVPCILSCRSEPEKPQS